MLRRLYNNALFHVGQHIRTGHVVRTVRHFVEPGKTVRLLDAGSGGGGISFALARALPGATIAGIELAPDKVAACAARARELDLANTAFMSGDLTRIEQHGVYDLAVSVDVLEHIEDDHAALRSIFGALAPGGIFVLHVPREHPRRLFPSLDDHHQHDHVRDGYDPEQLRTLLRATGFDVRSVRATFGLAGELAWELMQIGIRLGGRRGELLRIVLWPLLRMLSWIEIHVGGHRGNGILVIAARPGTDAILRPDAA